MMIQISHGLDLIQQLFDILLIDELLVDHLYGDRRAIRTVLSLIHGSIGAPTDLVVHIESIIADQLVHLIFI